MFTKSIITILKTEITIYS